jgi:hypothetical protein
MELSNNDHSQDFSDESPLNRNHNNPFQPIEFLDGEQLKMPKQPRDLLT